MNTNSAPSLQAVLLATIDSYKGRGEHFENGYSEGDMLGARLREYVKRLDEGEALPSLIEALAKRFGPVFSDGTEEYGYYPVRSAMRQAGFLEEFDSAVDLIRNPPVFPQAAASSESAPAPQETMGQRLRSFLRMRP